MSALRFLRLFVTPFNVIAALLLAGVLVVRTVQAGPGQSTIDPALLEPARGPRPVAQTVRLYLAAKDEDNSYLVETRRVSLPVDTPTQRAEAAARLWSTGPRPAGALKLLPAGDDVPAVLVRRDLAVLDLPASWREVGGGSAGELLVLCGLARTVLEFAQLARVQYTVGGRPAGTLAGHVAVDRPFTIAGCKGS